MTRHFYRAVRPASEFHGAEVVLTLVSCGEGRTELLGRKRQGRTWSSTLDAEGLLWAVSFFGGPNMFLWFSLLGVFLSHLHAAGRGRMQALNIQ